MAGRSSTTGATAIANPASRQGRHLDLWLPLALATLTAIVFSPIWDAEFVRRNDTLTVTENPAMLGPVSEVAHFWINLKTSSEDIYIPLTETAWYFLGRVARLNQPTPDGLRFSPFPFHFANLLLHALSGWLVYRILRRLRLPPWPAAAGAAVYLFHPLQVEAVAWVTGLKDTLSGALSLASIHAFLRFVQTDRAAARWTWYLTGTFSFVAAMLAKPASVVAPVLAFIVAMAWLALLRRDPSRQSNVRVPGIAVDARPLVIPLLIWLGLAAPILLEARHAQPANLVPDVALWLRPLIAGDALCFYLWKLVAPVSLGFDYSRTPAAVVRSGAVYWTWIVPAALLLLAYRFRKGKPLLLTGLLLFLAAPLPVLGLVKFGFQFFSTVADHYLYIAMLGAAVAGAAAMNAWGAQRIARLAGAAVLIVLSALTYLQSGYWHDDFALWYHAYIVNPDSFPVEWHVGKIFADRAGAESLAGDPQQARDDNARALEFFMRALPIDPDPAQSHRALAEVYFRQQDYAHAAEHYQAALSSFPVDTNLRCNLGIALEHQGRFAEARAALEGAIRLKPESADFEAKLGQVLVEQGDRDSAAEHFRRALTVDPGFEPARRALDQLQLGKPVDRKSATRPYNRPI